MLAKYRLGKFRYGLNYLPIASIAFGTIFKNIELYLPFIPINPLLLNNIFIFNLVLAVCTMLPIPPLDGHFLFYASRMWYVFLFATIFFYTVLTIVFEIYSWIWAIIIGLVILSVYYIYFERNI